MGEKGKQTRAKRILSMAVACILVFASGITTVASDVTPSKQEYTVEIDSQRAFIGNEKPVDVSGGKAVYMTYTVDKVDKDTAEQSGLIATKNNGMAYPYTEDSGIMKYNNMKSLWFKEGYTYFVKFEITKEFGFEVTVAYSNGKEEGYETSCSNTTGELTDGIQYCGLWFTNGEVKATLTHVRVYDKNGNDLGVVANGTTVIDPTLQAISGIEHIYEFSLKEQATVAISNAKYTQSDVIYMEYTVKNVKQASGYQHGVGMTNSPGLMYPHQGSSGYLRFAYLAENQGSVMLQEGMTYLVRFTRTDNDFQAVVRYTVDGRDQYHKFSYKSGTYDSNFGYAYIWLFNAVTADFVNVKCYDAEGKNLGIRLNAGAVEVKHYGGLEDYTDCIGGYYCASNNTFLGLKEDRSIVRYVSGEEKQTGKYTIYNEKYSMITEIDGGSSEYSYYYANIIDGDGNKYLRLKNNVVTFVTGTENVKEEANLENDYMVARPEDPVLQGNTFKGWFLSNGTEYDFEKVVAESVTVYAKWVDGDGNEYLATSAEMEETERNTTPIIVLGVCLIIVALTIVGGVFITRRGEKNEIR